MGFKSTFEVKSKSIYRVSDRLFFRNSPLSATYKNIKFYKYNNQIHQHQKKTSILWYRSKNAQFVFSPKCLQC